MSKETYYVGDRKQISQNAFLICLRKKSTEAIGTTTISFERWHKMKSLLDIQQDVRNLENILSDVQRKIKGIEIDIDGLRTSNHNTDMDYSEIEILSRNLTIGKHPIYKLQDDMVKKIYIKMLLSIVWLDNNEEVTLNRLVLIQRIQDDSGIDLSLEDMYKDSFRISMDSFYDMVEIIPVKYREIFVVDSLVIAYLGGGANAEISEYITGMFSLLGVNKEQLSILGLVAHVALCQEAKKMENAEVDIFIKYAKNFEHYIKPNILKNIVLSQRKIIVELSYTEVTDFKWKVKQEEMVEKGTLVATYKAKTRSGGYLFTQIQDKKVEVTLSYEGTIFQFRDNCTYYGVISHKSDNKESIKAWVKARRNSV